MKTIHLTLFILLFASAVSAQPKSPQGPPEISLVLSAKKKQKIDHFIVELEIKNISGKTIQMIDSFDEPDGSRRFFSITAYYGMTGMHGGGLSNYFKDIKVNYRYKTFKPNEKLRLKFNLNKWRGNDFFRPNEEVIIQIRYLNVHGENCVKGSFDSNEVAVTLVK